MKYAAYATRGIDDSVPLITSITGSQYAVRLRIDARAPAPHGKYQRRNEKRRIAGWRAPFQVSQMSET
ncbi:hypothetical protein [Pandoraea sp. ISTKB]|uniref:hypothetical protein n=1 Tax=Pandoraea sp. ISTKB TaxID=1586708 RepID=UPI00086ADF2E|nr:hypothetical protein [Pandoraea sp. ISTKB]ODP31589.1 hypothetical protein A9762_06240 [Pandoraea sp. ISTKB]